jgi:hypothetical protein
VTAAERQSAVDAYARSDWRLEPGMIPANKPALSTFAVADDGTLWVAPTLAAGSGFDVFDGQGVYLGRVDTSVPIGIGSASLRIRRGAIYGVARDSLNVEYLVRMRIQRAGN